MAQAPAAVEGRRHGWHPGWHLHRDSYWHSGLNPARDHCDIDGAMMPDPILHLSTVAAPSWADYPVDSLGARPPRAFSPDSPGNWDGTISKH